MLTESVVYSPFFSVSSGMKTELAANEQIVYGTVEHRHTTTSLLRPLFGVLKAQSFPYFTTSLIRPKTTLVSDSPVVISFIISSLV